MSGNRILIIPKVNYLVRGFCGDQIIDVKYTDKASDRKLEVTLQLESINSWDEAALIELVGTNLDVVVYAGTFVSSTYNGDIKPDFDNFDLKLNGTFLEAYYPNCFAHATTVGLTFGGGTPSWTRPKAKQVRR